MLTLADEHVPPLKVLCGLDGADRILQRGVPANSEPAHGLVRLRVRVRVTVSETVRVNL